MANVFTPFECPVKVRNSLPVAKSHILIVESLLPEINLLSSGVITNVFTLPLCPKIVFKVVLENTSLNRLNFLVNKNNILKGNLDNLTKSLTSIVPSRLPEMIFLLSDVIVKDIISC